MNAHLLASLIAIGIGVVNAAQADLATEPSDRELWLSLDSGRDVAIYLLEYIDAPTEAWRERLELYRLA